ncbi:hypothetical protein INR49_029529 [Caranx melampygus]|nr:hypothetical protein INR49_029529 [Caranx melampygus]
MQCMSIVFEEEGTGKSCLDKRLALPKFLLNKSPPSLRRMSPLLLFNGGGSSAVEADSYCESEKRPVQCLVTSTLQNYPSDPEDS